MDGSEEAPAGATTPTSSQAQHAQAAVLKQAMHQLPGSCEDIRIKLQHLVDHLQEQIYKQQPTSTRIHNIETA
eukprot:1668894-Prorocentrum_lima.AAC.1